MFMLYPVPTLERNLHRDCSVKDRLQAALHRCRDTGQGRVEGMRVEGAGKQGLGRVQGKGRLVEAGSDSG